MDTTIDGLSSKTIEWMSLVQGNSDKVEHLNNELTTLKREFVEAKEVTEDKDLRSIMTDVSTVNEKLEMIYGKMYFARRK